MAASVYFQEQRAQQQVYVERKEAEKAREQRDLHKRLINNQEPSKEEVGMGTHLGGLLLGSQRATQPEGAPPFDTFFLPFSLLSVSVKLHEGSGYI